MGTARRLRDFPGGGRGRAVALRESRSLRGRRSSRGRAPAGPSPRGRGRRPGSARGDRGLGGGAEDRAGRARGAQLDQDRGVGEPGRRGRLPDVRAGSGRAAGDSTGGPYRPGVMSMTRAGWKAVALGAVIGRPGAPGSGCGMAEGQMVTDGTLIYADRADPEGLDPTMFVGSAAFIQGHLLFDTLLARDNDGKLAPLLATSWQVSPDGRAYTFRLRNDVEFHGGKKLTSADVRYSLERLGNRQVASPWRDLVKSVERVETPDAYTVVIRLAKANRL